MDQTLTLEQMIPISGMNRVRSGIAAEALAVFETVRRQQLDIITKVRSSYFWLLRSYALLDLNEINAASFHQTAEVARSRCKTGKGSAVAALLAETKTSRVQETRPDIERMISDEKTQINILMNGAPLLATRHAEEGGRAPPRPVSGANANPHAGTTPRVRIALAQVEADKERVRLSCREWIPDPAISVQGQRYNDTDHIASELNTGISFSIPWENPEKYAAETKGGAEQPCRRVDRPED